MEKMLVAGLPKGNEDISGYLVLFKERQTAAGHAAPAVSTPGSSPASCSLLWSGCSTCDTKLGTGRTLPVALEAVLGRAALGAVGPGPGQGRELGTSPQQKHREGKRE